MKKIFYFMFFAMAMFVAACGGKKDKPVEEKKDSLGMVFGGDKTVYGLACEGCSDSVVYLLPSDYSDPLKYDIIDATRNKKVLGNLKVGDWIGLVINDKDSTVADLVLDIDQLKGSWCYIVMPKMRDYDKLSKKQQARMERDMSDSLKEQYLVPREYGFTLQNNNQASSIGWVREASALEAESPVVYPKMQYYIGWSILNGKLVMSRTGNENHMAAIGNNSKDVEIDTIDVVFLSDDSLVLAADGVSRSYYRISKATEANKLAREKAEKSAKAALKSITSQDEHEGHDHEAKSEQKVEEAKAKKK